jgi:uncharacterized membrane protein
MLLVMLLLTYTMIGVTIVFEVYFLFTKKKACCGLSYGAFMLIA